MKVGWLDLGSEYSAIRQEMDAAYHRVMESGRLILGGEVKRFEKSFAEYCGAGHCVGVGNGLDALHLALLAFGIGPRDEVIVPSNTYIATWLAVAYSGAVPVPVEPDPMTFNMDPERVEAAIGERTRAILPVDLYGQPADAQPLMEMARKHDLKVIIDAAQSHGARYRGRRTGSYGDAACFSFYPTKNLGALGDGGAVVTSDQQIADRVRMLGNYGSKEQYVHEAAGFNSRLDELQAAFLNVKLGHLEEWNLRRREAARRYTRGIEQGAAADRITVPALTGWADPSWHLYVVRVRDRDAVRKKMAERGVSTLIHYPVPPHLQPAFASLGYARGSFPVAEQISESIISLPLHPHLSTEEQDYVIGTLELSA